MIVTGSRGFIGSVFALRAIERGHRVLALDDESRGENDIAERIGSSYLKYDCARGICGALEQVAPGAQVDVVAHFAAATGSLDRPLAELLELNVDMTRHVYQDALTLNAKTFLWPTTSLALGVPDSPYVESKERALAMLKEVDQAARISVPLRFFNVAGAYKGLSEFRKQEVHLIPTLARLHASGEALTINGDDYDTVDGTPSRDFVHVLDVVEYLLDMAEGAAVVPCHDDGAVWLGTGYATTVKQVVALYEQFVGDDVDVKIGPRRAFDCGSLTVAPDQALQFARCRGGLAPAWMSIRDEVKAMRGWRA